MEKNIISVKLFRNYYGYVYIDAFSNGLIYYICGDCENNVLIKEIFAVNLWPS